jgi:DNA-binding transcriptional regulator YhcF (GntR family)
MPKRARQIALPPMGLDRRAPTPLHRQVFTALRAAIREARIAPGQRLPSTRALAQTLRLSRNIIASAYEQLLAEGYVTARVGSGTRAARALPDTYLRELPILTKDALAVRGKSLRRIVFEACYPVSASSLADPDGNVLFLFSADA